MNKKTSFSLGILAAALCLTMSGSVRADTLDTAPQPPSSNDKMGGNPNPKYDSGGSNNVSTTANTSAESTTVPSGKRHRTHKKHGNAGQTKDANKTINAGDVTPSN